MNSLRNYIALTAIEVNSPVVIKGNATKIVFSAEGGAFDSGRVGWATVLVVVVVSVAVWSVGVRSRYNVMAT